MTTPQEDTMKTETILKIGIGSALIAMFALGAWVLSPNDPKRQESTARADEDEDTEPKAEKTVIRSVVRAGEKQVLAARADAGEADPGDSPLVETDVKSLAGGQWMEEKYDQAYVYTGTALSKEEQNAKKGIFTEATLRAREEELIRTNPVLWEGIEAERVAREAERERFKRSGGLTVEEEAIQNGVQLED
jgi:hypothetical protein